MSARSAPELTAAARVHLFPLLLKPGDGGILVIRRDTGGMLQTSEAGADSIRLLQRGLTLDAVARELGRRYGCDPATVDVTPLIRSLVDADFVRTIDGRAVSTSRVRLAALVRGTFAASIAAPTATALIRHAPLGVSLGLLLRRRSRPGNALAGRIAENMKSVPGLNRSAAEIEAMAGENAAALRRYHIERLLLGVLPPHKLDCWLRERAIVSGSRHLRDAAAGGAGVVLCAFHMSAYSLVPFILAAHGFPHLVLVGGSEGSDAEIRHRIGQLAAAGCRYAIDVAAGELAGRRMLRQLRAGGTVLLYCDATPDAVTECALVPFLGRRLRLATGIARVSARTNARILPLVLTSPSRGRYRIDIHPPLPPATSADDEAMRTIARVLEREVHARPAEWLKWKDLPAVLGPAAS